MMERRHAGAGMMAVSLILAAAGGLFAADPAPLTPEQALKAMVVPDGFKVTLCAAEPQVVQPIAFAIDDRGRLWVAENESYPKWAKEGHDRIVVFEDTDGDGRFDKR